MLLLSKCMFKVHNKYKYLYCWFQTGTYPLVAFTLAFLIIANFEPTLHKKWSFPLRIPSANVDLFTFTEEILNEKLHFLYSATRGNRNCVNNLKEKQPRSSHQRCSVRKIVVRDFTKFTGKHWCQSLFLNNLIEKETLSQVFSCKFCEISKNTFFMEHLWATASTYSKLS